MPFSVLPFITSISPAQPIQPGTLVTLTGGGFSPAVQIHALSGTDNESITPVTYLNPNTVSFTLIRPNAFVLNPPGAFSETFNIEAVLSSGVTSNPFQVQLQTFRIAVVGDSVGWGEGLLTSEKYSTLVQQAIANNFSKSHGTTLGAYVDNRLAQCGAVLGVSDASSAQPAPANEQEIIFTSSIMSQVQAIQTPASVNLVLLNGGINDVGVSSILNPLTSTGSISASAQRFCQNDMTSVITHVATLCPNAKILVTGYYPILSPASNTLYFEALFTVVVGPVTTILGSAVLGLASMNQMINNCETFYSASNTALTAAVAAANQSIAGPTRVFFVPSGFTDSNATFASSSSSLLWGLNINGLSIGAQDPNAAARVGPCSAAYQGSVNLTRTFCELASVGHPNPNGAIQYANQIIPFATGVASVFKGTLQITVTINGVQQQAMSVTIPSPLTPSAVFFFTPSASNMESVQNTPIPFSTSIVDMGTPVGNVTVSITGTIMFQQNGQFNPATGDITGLGWSIPDAVATPQNVPAPPIGPGPQNLTVSTLTMSTTGTGGSPTILTGAQKGAVTLVGSAQATGGSQGPMNVTLKLTGTLSPVP